LNGDRRRHRRVDGRARVYSLGVRIAPAAAVLVAALSLAQGSCAGGGTVVYTNDFSGPAGTTYPEWSAPRYSWTRNDAGTIEAGAGTERVTNVDSPNGSQRFLAELGGPIVLKQPRTIARTSCAWTSRSSFHSGASRHTRR
jgi:hypothetical protein